MYQTIRYLMGHNQIVIRLSDTPPIFSSEFVYLENLVFSFAENVNIGDHMFHSIKLCESSDKLKYSLWQYM
jgi:hypothetical protein